MKPIELSGIRVTVAHIRQEKLCLGGARTWFIAQGLDYLDFFKNGIAVEVIEATGDALGLRVAKRARQEAEHGR